MPFLHLMLHGKPTKHQHWTIKFAREIKFYLQLLQAAIAFSLLIGL